MNAPGAAPIVVERSFTRVAAIVAIASAPLAAGNLFAMLATVHFEIGGMTDPLVLLHAGRAAAPLWRWSMVLDIFGYYLPIVPLVLLLRTSLRDLSPSWTDLFALCLLAYCLLGASGGAVLATALPTLIREYATSPAHRVALQAVFTGYTDAVYRGMWNLLEELLAGVGWIGLGIVLRLHDPRLGLVTIVLGAACVVDSIGTMLGSGSDRFDRPVRVPRAGPGLGVVAWRSSPQGKREASDRPRRARQGRKAHPLGAMTLRLSASQVGGRGGMHDRFR